MSEQYLETVKTHLEVRVWG